MPQIYSWNITCGWTPIDFLEVVSGTINNNVKKFEVLLSIESCDGQCPNGKPGLWINEEQEGYLHSSVTEMKASTSFGKLKCLDIFNF